ncbi:hypothetical protein IGI04_025437 [Brassica rapa subsp. trilocularis]|uniref:Uncharacterized protein n=1 Tax=Brassica rapa subsp. trilocularis TaxID=1813537 RepID=A0ABQ7KT31_BRACM|nr:hypothetical protein IGI04_025437 [Brassica rapa subsp. trilocularis]
MSLCGIGPEAGWVWCISRDPRGSAKNWSLSSSSYDHRTSLTKTLCIHHPYQTGLFSLKSKDTKPIKSGYTLASYLSILILLCLPTKDSVRTSILSTRFRNIWLQVPRLELHSHDFSDPAAIKNFIDRFLEINRDSRLQKFKIKYDEYNVYLFRISELIAEAINRGVHDLDIGTLKSPLTEHLMHVLMKIGVPRTCTAKACASRGSGLGSSFRNRIPRGHVPRRSALTVYRSGAGQGGSVQPNCHL